MIRQALVIAVVAFPLLGQRPAAKPVEAPNVAPICARLVSAGEPAAASLAGLGGNGVGAVNRRAIDFERHDSCRPSGGQPGELDPRGRPRLPGTRALHRMRAYWN